jgi:hypothetical protein
MMEGMMTRQEIAEYVRREAASKGYGTAQDGSLFVRATRHGCDWALELCDETPIDTATAQAWANAVGVPLSADDHATTCAAGRVWRYEWTGTEDAAPEGSKATWLKP